MHPGDVIVGDEDGVVVIPQNDLVIVVARLQEVFAKEAKMLAAIEAGYVQREIERAARDDDAAPHGALTTDGFDIRRGPARRQRRVDAGEIEFWRAGARREKRKHERAEQYAEHAKAHGW